MMLFAKVCAFAALLPAALAGPITGSAQDSNQEPRLSQLSRRTASSGTYVVVTGDTSNAISAAYSITFSTLSKANPNVNWNALQAGQSLVMPSARKPINHKITSSDSLSSLATKYDVYSTDIQNANPGINFSQNLPVGQKMRVPGYGRYTSYSVVSGDTGYEIAGAFGVPFSSLSTANPNVNWNSLQIGQTLTVPAGTSPTTGTIPSPATSPAASATTSSKTTTLTTPVPLTSSSSIVTTTLVTSTAPTTTSSAKSSTTLSSVVTTTVSTTKLSSVASSSTAAFYTTSVTSGSSSVSTNSGALNTPTSLASGTSATSSTSSTVSSTPPSTTINKPTSSTATSTSISSSSTQSSTTLKTAPTVSSTTTSSSLASTTAIPSTTTTTKTATTTTATTTTTPYTPTGTAITQTATVTGPNAVTTLNNNDSNTPSSDTYKWYQGDGSAAAGWPAISAWISFQTMWQNLSPYLGQSCSNIWGVANNSPAETQAIYNAIQAVAQKSGVDHRLILAVIVQESSGCVRVPTTTSPDGTITNPGLMQTYNGQGTCNKNGVIQNPCPAPEIYQMVEDGVFGTGPNEVVGLVEDINAQNGYTGSQAIYRAARVYNAGSVPASGDLGAPGATRCYCSDIANRLTGWITAARTCNYS